MSKFFSDFKKFATKGNIIDMAVGVVMGTAFGKIVSSLVNDILMPFISLMVGGASIKDLKVIIRPGVIEEGKVIVAESALMYGSFLQAIIDFLLIAFCIFLMLRLIMNAKLNLEKFGGMMKASSADEKALRAKLKADGCTRSQIKVAVANLHAEVAKKAEEDEKLKKAEAEAAKPETQEKILGDIRELLLAQSNGAKDSEDAKKPAGE